MPSLESSAVIPPNNRSSFAVSSELINAASASGSRSHARTASDFLADIKNYHGVQKHAHDKLSITDTFRSTLKSFSTPELRRRTVAPFTNLRLPVVPTVPGYRSLDMALGSFIPKTVKFGGSTSRFFGTTFDVL